MLHLIVGVMWAVIFFLGSVYTPRRVIFWIEELQRVLLSHTMAVLSLAGLLYLAKKEFPRLTFAYFFSLALLLLIGYRLFLRLWHRVRRYQSSGVTRILVVGAGRVGRDLVLQFRRQHWAAYEVIGFLDDDPDKRRQRLLDIPVIGRIDDAVSIVGEQQVDEVIIALPLHAHVRLANLVARLHELPVRLRVVPDYFDLAFHGASIESLGGIPLIGLRDPAIDGFQRFGKRLMDIVFSIVGILLFSPVMLAVAVAIKLEDRGDILYQAPRRRKWQAI